MRLAANLDFVYRARIGIKTVHGVVIAATQPKVFTIYADVAHVRAATARNGPRFSDFFGCKIHHGNAARTIRCAPNFVTATVGDIKTFAIAARVNAKSYDGQREFNAWPL